ncbi:MAG: chorismate-binding protein [Marinilabiliaceae bacterium]
MQNSQDKIRAASFAIYRLPLDGECHIIRAEPTELGGMGETTGHTGFVMTPFALRGGLPTLLFEGRAEAIPSPVVKAELSPSMPAGQMTNEYLSDFRSLHGELTSGKLRKVVLARSRRVELGQGADLMRMFANACAAYPTAFVALVTTGAYGTWIVASPELLVESHGGRLRTVALAGTMRRGDGQETPRWSKKNREEQAVVADYVRDSIQPIAKDCEQGETETVTSGGLNHLMTTFRFSLREGKTVADVANALHPTPAVCGMPKDAALKTITEVEHCQREYYSGFAGPVTADGDADLYVTLRCAKIDGSGCTLFAGGGLMPESRAEDEWDETEAKMESIRRIL